MPSNMNPSFLNFRRAVSPSAAFAASAMVALGVLCVAASHAALPADYRGIPYVDSVFQGPFVIPGRVQCVYFDYGGEGVAFHSDGTNHGNHDFNLVEHRGPKCSLYISQFRANEGVSQITKSATASSGCVKFIFSRKAFIEALLGCLGQGFGYIRRMCGHARVRCPLRRS